jgi:PIN domain nuclease of toxin-antitoxin system
MTMRCKQAKLGRPMLEKIEAAVFDTHVWIRASAGDPQLGELRNFHGTVIVPAISVWEVAMLASKGRIDLQPDADRWIRENLQPPVRLEPLHPEISLESCRLEDFHGDPADRLIVATALVLGVPLITADRQIINWNERHAQLQIIRADSLVT